MKYFGRAHWFEYFKAHPEVQANFAIERHDRQGNRFPSAEAMEDLNDKMIACVGGKMMAHYDRTGRTPKVLKVRVVVEIED